MIFFSIEVIFRLKNAAMSRGVKINTLLTVCSFITLFFGLSSPVRSQQCESTAIEVGYRTIDYHESRLSNSATEQKPESKLWWNDGLWWGILWDPNLDVYRIQRFNADSQCWFSVGPNLDDRPKSSADVLWDDFDQKLYVSSRAKENHRGDKTAYFFRYSYDPNSQSYSLDDGFPAAINDKRSESLVIAKDSSGKIWATWEEETDIMVNRSLDSHTDWGTPFVLPTQGKAVSGDDISSIVAFGDDKIGILWSNQRDEAVYFAVHQDGDPDTDWQQAETALFDENLGGVADDHLNLAAHPDGTVLAVSKTSVNGETDPQIFLLKRDPFGTWSRYVFSIDIVNHTRPLVLVNSDNDSVYVVAKGKSNPIKIYMKRTHLSNPQFEPGLGETFIFSSEDDNINDPTSTKQTINSHTGLLVLASDKSSQHYFHNFLELSGDEPIITSFAPEEGVVGTEVTVNGGNFSNLSDVQFNGHSAPTFAVDSGSRLRAVVPDGANTGKLRITSAGGSTSSDRDFTVILAPEITGFSPTDGSAGDEITVSGNHFVRVSQVTFDGMQAEFTVDSESQLRAEIPSGANTGPLTVSNPAGLGASDSDFKVNFFPMISSFSPKTGGVGTIVTLTGTNLSTTTDVAFANVSAEFEIESETSLRTEVPAGAIDGKIRVVNVEGQTESDEDFGVILRPVISSVSPDTGHVGSEITITGSHFLAVTGVGFGGTPAASFTVDSESQLRAEVPINASSGPVLVVNPAGESVSSEDLVIIKTFKPTDDAYVWSGDPTGNFGTSNILRVRETSSSEWRTFFKFSLDGLVDPVTRASLRLMVASTSVDGGSIHAVANSYRGSEDPWVEEGIDWNNAPEITGTALSSLAKVTSGEIVEFDVTSAINGNGFYSFAIENNSSDVAYYQSKEGDVAPELIIETSTGPKPVISSFTPQSGVVGTEIAVNGFDFTDITAVSFNGTPAINFFVDSNSSLRAEVPSGAQTGKIRVTGRQGFDESGLDFTVIQPPVLASFTPDSGPSGGQVTILGAHLSQVTAVSFGDVPASNFSIASHTEILAEVPAGALAGKIVVINPAGTARSDSNFAVIQRPIVNGFAPQEGSVGVQVTLSGANFASVNEVSFDGVSSSHFSIESDSLLLAQVPVGAKTGKITVVNIAGSGQTVSSFTVTQAPIVSSFEPEAAVAGTDVTITGSGLASVTEVAFNGTLAPDFTVDADTKITVAVPTEAASGAISVTNQIGTGHSSSDFVVIDAPVLAAFSPQSGPVGTEVTITGSDLSHVTEIAFNETPVAGIDVESDSQVRITVPAGAATGRISVTNAAATVKSDSPFVVITLPAISSFNPSGGPVGSKVTLTGSYLRDVTEVFLGGTSAPDFTADSDTTMQITVPEGASSGTITLTNQIGTAESNSDFTVILPPVLSSFTPANGPVSSEVTINGTNLASVTEIAFNSTRAPDFTVGSDSQLRVRVPQGATGGPITVTNAAGSESTLTDFEVTEAGQLTVELTDDAFVYSKNPEKNYGAAPQLRVRTTSSAKAVSFLKFTISGLRSTIKEATLNLSVIEDGADGGTVHLASNSYSGSSSSWKEENVIWTNAPEIGENLGSVGSVVVGDHIAIDVTSAIAGDGTYSFAIKGGNSDVVMFDTKEGANAPELTITLDAPTPSDTPPTISSFAPTTGAAGQEVTILGTNFITVNQVRFNGSPASFITDSDGQIGATVPAGATTGKLTIETVDQAVQSAEDFVVIVAPTILSFTPQSGMADDQITITGVHLAAVTSVSFNGVTATNLTAASETEIRAKVPVGATTGPIRVTGATGTGISSSNFAVLQPPQISSFNPSSGPIGSDVTISGGRFGGTTQVYFESVQVESFRVESDSKIIARVPAGATTGTIRVVNAAGEAFSATDFTVLLTPMISSFTPASGVQGIEVTITGANFTDASDVSFNGVPTSSFIIDSDTQVRAVVPETATTGPLAITTVEGVGTSGADFAISAPTGEIVVQLTDDTFVHSKNPDKNYGDSNELRVRKTASARMVSFLKFSVSGLNQPPQKATLQLYVNDAGDDGGSLYAVSNNYKDSDEPWTEDGMVWKNAPEIDGNALDSVGSVELGQTIEFNVTEIVSEDGVFSFAIQNTGDDAVRYDPKEGINPPQLIIEVDDSPPAPTIASFQPTTGPVGTEITISGSNLNGATRVHFGETLAADFAQDSDSRIRAKVPSGAKRGKISITAENGHATSSKDFHPISEPEIVTFAPASGAIGTEVTLTGSGFTGLTEISFSGVVASHFRVDSETRARATVPPLATTGPILVVNPAGSAETSVDFEVLESQSNSLSFVPTDDSVVRSTKPTKNYGEGDELVARRSSSIYLSYLKFTVNGVNRPIETGVIRLHVLDGSDEGGEMFSVSNNYEGSNSPWEEGGLIWNNAPPLTGAPLSSRQAVSLGQQVEFDVTAAITGDGIYSFALSSGSLDAAKYSSKEGSLAPELVITFASDGNSVTKKSEPQATSSLSDEAGLVQTNLLLPESLMIHPNYPNPFNASTTIEYGLPKAGRVFLSVYNLKGQEVKRLVDAEQTAGFKKVLWNGKNASDIEVASGVYLVRLRFADTSLSRMITLQK